MNNLLILDIDETLLHSTYEDLKREPNFYFKERGVYLRPYLNKFLENCFKKYDVAIWTSAKADYAKFILKKITGDLSKFKFIWTRNNCQRITKWNGFMNVESYIKDLTKIQGYELENIKIIDDTPQNIIPTENVLFIEEYRGNKEDDNLIQILHLLNEIN
jgi:TFIIF-interacting CTD phosphatase-like protein